MKREAKEWKLMKFIKSTEKKSEARVEIAQVDNPSNYSSREFHYERKLKDYDAEEHSLNPTFYLALALVPLERVESAIKQLEPRLLSSINNSISRSHRWDSRAKLARLEKKLR
jgi:actin-related protein